MAFNTEDKLVGDVLTKTVFIIPRNQRRYVWKKENWEELLEDIYFSKVNDTPAHFLGSVVFQDDGKKDGIDYRIIIDGQQRITTITIILLAILRLFCEYGMIDDYEGTEEYVYIKNTRNQRHPIIASDYHLSLEKMIEASASFDEDNLESVSKFLSTVILDKKDRILADAYKHMYESIKKKVESAEDCQEELRLIRDTVIGMQIISIVSTTEEDAYTIFEILNARGQELQDFELLKNYIMRYIQPVDIRDVAKNEWEAIESKLGTKIKKYIDHYAWHKYGAGKEKESAYRIIQRGSKGGNIRALLDDIKIKSEYYYKIVNPQRENCSNCEYQVFSFFKTKKQEQFRPMILSIMHHKELGDLDDELYENTLWYMYNFFVCFNLIGKEKSNRLRDTILKYAYILENDYSNDSLIAFTDDLKKKIPSRELFKKQFRNVGWSNHTDIFKSEDNKKQVQITLEIIEKYISKRESVDEFTIEHMYPDKDGEKNASIGNLIPLELRLNQRCETKSLNEKADIYSESNFASARNMSIRIKEGKFDIDSRTDFLADLIYEQILSLSH